MNVITRRGRSIHRAGQTRLDPETIRTSEGIWEQRLGGAVEHRQAVIMQDGRNSATGR